MIFSDLVILVLGWMADSAQTGNVGAVYGTLAILIILFFLSPAIIFGLWSLVNSKPKPVRKLENLAAGMPKTTGNLSKINAFCKKNNPNLYENLDVGSGMPKTIENFRKTNIFDNKQPKPMRNFVFWFRVPKNQRKP